MDIAWSCTGSRDESHHSVVFFFNEQTRLVACRVHSNHCVQLMLACSGTLLVRSRAGVRWRRSATVPVPPDVLREIEARASR